MIADSLGAAGGAASGRARTRDVGITIGRLAAGLRNAITDVLGVRVGHNLEAPIMVNYGPCFMASVIACSSDNAEPCAHARQRPGRLAPHALSLS